jgi:hypothetical protein
MSRERWANEHLRAASPYSWSIANVSWKRMGVIRLHGSLGVRLPISFLVEQVLAGTLTLRATLCFHETTRIWTVTSVYVQRFREGERLVWVSTMVT